MNTTVQLALTAEEIDQLLRLTQKGYERAGGDLSQTDLIAYNRLLGKLRLDRAEGLSAAPAPKRKYTPRAAKTPAATKTGRKRGRPAKKVAAADKESAPTAE
jgi:hypothetical protein